MTDNKHAGNGIVLFHGSINADFQLRLERRSAISETLQAMEFKRVGGGKAANVAYFVRKLGCHAVLFAHAGDDDLAAQALQPLVDIGVDTAGVSKVAGSATGVAVVMVPPDGKKGIVFPPNANMDWTDEDATEVAQQIFAAAAGAVLVMVCGVAAHVLERAAAAAVRSKHSL